MSFPLYLPLGLTAGNKYAFISEPRYNIRASFYLLDLKVNDITDKEVNILHCS